MLAVHCCALWAVALACSVHDLYNPHWALLERVRFCTTPSQYSSVHRWNARSNASSPANIDLVDYKKLKCLVTYFRSLTTVYNASIHFWSSACPRSDSHCRLYEVGFGETLFKLPNYCPISDSIMFIHPICEKGEVLGVIMDEAIMYSLSI